MKTILIAAIVLLLTASCGAKQEPETETVATTADLPSTNGADAADETDETIEEPADPNQIPAPADVAAAPPNAETSDSGLAWIVLNEGDGAGSPTVESTIKVHYTGWTTDGKMFDSSVARGEPIEFPLAKLIPGWQEGIPMMSKGEKRRFWIPGELAYANSPRPDAPKGLLVFEIELLDFNN